MLSEKVRARRRETEEFPEPNADPATPSGNSLCYGRGIKELPESILQHIMSFMDYTDVIRASAVSKAWRTAVSTLVCLNVTDDFILRQLDARSVKEKNKESLRTEMVRLIMISATRFIRRAVEQNLHIQKFSLKFRGEFHRSMSDVTDSLSHNNDHEHLREFVFDVGSEGICMSSNSSLPKLYLCAVPSLSKLVLGGLKLIFSEDGNIVDLPLLRELHLRSNRIDDNSLEQFIMNCPQLETLEIHDCFGFEALKVLESHHKLKRVELINDIRKEDGYTPREIKNVEIKEAPNLELFRYIGNGKDILPSLDVAACRNLKALELINLRGDHKLLKSTQQLVSCLIALEVFQLHIFKWIDDDDKGLKSIRISSDSIRELWLAFVDIGVDVEVEVPHLSKFFYHGFIASTLSLEASSSAEVYFVIPQKERITHDKLIEFVRSFNHIKAVKLEDFAPSQFKGLKRLRHNMDPPLWDVKHLSIGAFCARDNGYIPVDLEILETLLWMAPQLDTLSFDGLQSTITFQFIHENSQDADVSSITRSNNLIKIKVESCPSDVEGFELKKYYFDDEKSLAGNVKHLKVLQIMLQSRGDCMRHIQEIQSKKSFSSIHQITAF